MTTKLSKRIRAHADKHPGTTPQSVEAAVEVLKRYNNTKFDQSVDIAIHLGVDPKQADQIVRGSLVLPHGIGKTLRVIVFAKGDLAAAAQEAGADEIGGEDLAKKIKEGWTEFDACIAAPDMMGIVGPLGRVLGPRGLMPNPKAGTVVPAEDIPRVVEESKAGRVEFRVDKTANLHVPIGKVSFDEKKLYDNLAALMEAVKKARPPTTKGTFIRRVTLTTTMGPGIKVDPIQAQSMEARE